MNTNKTLKTNKPNEPATDAVNRTRRYSKATPGNIDVTINVV